MTAKQYLGQLYKLEDEIKCDQRELERIRLLAVSVPTAAYGKEVIHSDDISNRTETSVIKIDEYEKILAEKLSAKVELRSMIYQSIEELKTPKERLVLKYRYLEFMDWTHIADCMEISERTAHMIHGSALKKIKVPQKFR